MMPKAAIIYGMTSAGIPVAILVDSTGRLIVA